MHKINVEVYMYIFGENITLHVYGCWIIYHKPYTFVK